MPQNQQQQQPPPQIQSQQQLPYEPNLSPQRMKERDAKLNRLGQLAQIAPQNMQQPSQRLQPQQQTQVPPPQQPPMQQQTQQQPPPPPPQVSQQQTQQQQQHVIKQEHMDPDPLRSMAAMTDIEHPVFQPTIHHHPRKSFGE